MSVGLLAIVLGEAFTSHSRRSGLETFVALASSKPRLLVLGNAALMLAATVTAALASALFGTLRRAEHEYLFDRCTKGALEFILVLAMFRHTMTWRFTALVGVLAVCKLLHWMARGRVEWLAQGLAQPGRFVHGRTFLALLLLTVTDVVALRASWGGGDLAWPPPADSVLFLFQYAALAAHLTVTIAEFLLSAAPDSWRGKAATKLAVEAGGEGLQLAVYSGLLLAIWQDVPRPPLYLLAQMLDSAEQLGGKVQALVKYRQLTQANSRYILEVDEETARAAGLLPGGAEGEEPDVCIVCRDALAPLSSLRRLHCGHIFHGDCLHSWLLQQQACPTCTRPLTELAAADDRAGGSDAEQRPGPDRGHERQPEPEPEPEPAPEPEQTG